MTDVTFDASQATAALRARGLQRELLIWVGRLLVIAALMALWQFGSGRIFSAYWFSNPVAVATKLHKWVADGVLLTNTAFTLGEMGAGLAIGGLAGVLCGFLLGLSPRLAAIFEPLVIALYNVPKLALAPMFILWFGIGMGPKIVLVALVSFFLMFISTLSGVRDINRDLVDSMRVMGARPLDMLTKLFMPATAPFIRTGFRISMPYALTSAVAGEMMLSQSGLGYMLRRSADVMDMTGVYAILLVLLVVGVVLDIVAGSRAMSEKRFDNSAF